MTRVSSSKPAKRKGQYHLAPGAARQMLLRSAIKLLNRDGPGHVSLNDVARDAKLNPALVKYYFGSKSKLFHAVLEQVVGEWRTEILAAVSETMPPVEALRRRARTTMEFLRRYPSLTRLMHQTMMTDTKEGRFFVETFARVNFEEHRRILQRGIADGSFRPVDPAFFFINYVNSGDLFGLALPIMRRVFGSKRPDDQLFQAFSAHAIDMMIDGIAARPVKRRKAKT
ncbi:MAG: TetR family transcriptional regulator [Pseudolabrys sp.]|nr:TetR family transcriptional regulator [Pseudolabrys sp.]